MKEYYTMTIAGCERKLPLFSVNEHMRIAAFILFSDVEVTMCAAKALLEKVPQFDAILTPEAKSIPLAYEMSRQSQKPYYVARKGVKVYMRDPLKVAVRSITTQKEQALYLGQDEAQALCGKRVLLVDDVVSTGESMEAIAQLLERAGGEVAAKCAVLAEGEAKERKDLLYLEPLPLFVD